MLEVLSERWPAVFPTDPIAIRPWAINLNRQILDLFPGKRAITLAAIRLWHERNSQAYLRALAAGGPRFDLEGQPQGVVSAEEQARALLALQSQEPTPPD